MSLPFSQTLLEFKYYILNQNKIILAR